MPQPRIYLVTDPSGPSLSSLMNFQNSGARFFSSLAAAQKYARHIATLHQIPTSVAVWTLSTTSPKKIAVAILSGDIDSVTVNRRIVKEYPAGPSTGVSLRNLTQATQPR